jgi:hypothetical protein
MLRKKVQLLANEVQQLTRNEANLRKLAHGWG